MSKNPQFRKYSEQEVERTMIYICMAVIGAMVLMMIFSN